MKKPFRHNDFVTAYDDEDKKNVKRLDSKLKSSVA